MKWAAIACFVLGLGVFGVWYFQGHRLATETQRKVTLQKVLEKGAGDPKSREKWVEVTSTFDADLAKNGWTKAVDDMGDEEKKPAMVPSFKLGLMDAAGPAGGALFLIGAVLVFLARRKGKQAAKA